MKRFSLLNFPRYSPRYYPLSKFKALKVTGPDASSFLQAQLTCDVTALESGRGCAAARLNRSGQLLSSFFLLFDEDYILLGEKESLKALREDLEKYIIMEDVEILPEENLYYWYTTHESLPEKSFKGSFYLPNSYLGKQYPPHAKLLSTSEFKILETISLLPFQNKNKILVTDTILMEEAVSLKKGCYLGQETVAKIVNNRGAAYAPVFFKLKERKASASEGSLCFDGEKKIGKVLGNFFYQGYSYFSLSLLRNYRVKNRSYTFKIDNQSYVGTIVYPPFFHPNSSSSQDLAQELVEMGTHLFSRDAEKAAEKYFRRAISIDPTCADAYESLGVLLGRHEKFEEAIKQMDKLLESDPDSVMAHTNKSLYFMRLGKIEEAEEEKALATVATFKALGRQSSENKSKNIEDQLKQEEEQKRKEREEMFRQVLEIDPEDVIANFGLADIAFAEERYKEAIELLEKVINIDVKYSTAYLLLGKCHFHSNQKEKAQKIFEEGIAIATQKGDLMPANEMQSYLLKLT